MLQTVELAIARRYGEILNVAFVCMLYGGAMPLLYWVTPGAFAISYWTEKFEILKVSAQLPVPKTACP